MSLPIEAALNMDMTSMSNMSMTNSSMDHSGMDMGGSCKISMLWNWYTVDTCFLSSTWHNTTKAMFAGSVIGVFLLCIAIEFVRRLGREYDSRLVAQARLKASLGASAPTFASASSSNDQLNKDLVASPSAFIYTPSWPHQILRGLLYGSQFSAAFLVMLLGMYYNGFILFAIFIGQTVGYIAFGRDTCTLTIDHATTGHCC